VTGHTDDVGADADNQRLSEARATSVGRYLVQRGVNAQRITQQGMGEIAPKLPNTSETNRAANRRVELAIKANNNAGANNPQTQPTQSYPTTNRVLLNNRKFITNGREISNGVCVTSMTS
jgi:hypothetical protein